MDLLITLLVIGVIVFFGKFIYDSYLTDNTEKNWEKYKQNHPQEASKIEIQDMKNIYDLETKYKPKKEIRDGILKNRFPNFYQYMYELKDLLNTEFVKDDGLTIEFRYPIITLGQITAYLYIGIKDELGDYHLFTYGKLKTGEIINEGEIQLTRDYDINKYNDVMNKLLINTNNTNFEDDITNNHDQKVKFSIEKWEWLYENNALMEIYFEGQNFHKIKEDFFFKDKIVADKFMDNYSNYFENTSICDPEYQTFSDKKHVTPSISEFNPNYNPGISLPFWFISAYPDVTIHFIEKYKTGEVHHLFGPTLSRSIKEDDFSSLRELIEDYKFVSENRLECG